MYYRLKPKPDWGKRCLKRFYRLIYVTLGIGPQLPEGWRERPSVLVPEIKLGLVIDRLNRGGAIW